MQQRSKTRSWRWGWISPRPRESSRRGRSTWRPRRRVVQPTKKARNKSGGDKEPDFLGEPFNAHEARTKWPQRYQRGPQRGQIRRRTSWRGANTALPRSTT